MKKIWVTFIVLLGLTLSLPGPGWAQGKAQPKKPEPKKEGSMPTASGTALGDYLQKENYQKNWKMWPGTGAFSPGKSPHGALINIYVNDIVLQAVQGKKGKLPDGSVVAKENYSADKKYLALTVMYKIKGYNPGADDWYWAKYAPDGKVEGEGKIEGCINCHGKKRNNDYIWTAPLK